jgi:hypothetical protein
MNPTKGIAAPGEQAAATGKTGKSANPHSTIGDHLQEADPLLGWFGLAAGVKASKLRQMKRGWQRKGGM